MNVRKIMGTILGLVLFFVTIVTLTYAYYSWRSGDTSVSFNINDSYFFCEAGRKTTTTGLGPVSNYKSGAYQSFSVNNVGGSAKDFSVSLDIESIDSALKSSDVKWKLVVDDTGNNRDCSSSSVNCTSVSEGNYANVVQGMNTLVPSVSLASNARNKYYLFTYVDGNAQNSTAIQNSTLKATVNVCDVMVYLNYNCGTGTPEYLKLSNSYTGLPTSPTRTSKITYDANGGTSVSDTSFNYTFNGWYKNLNDNNSRVTEGSTMTDTTNHTLYAKWNQSTTNIIVPTSTKTGFTLEGWYPNSNFTGTKLASNVSLNECGATYYAKWNVNAPTADEYCKTNLKYNGGSQTLVNTAGSGFNWDSSTTSKTNAGSYTVSATPVSGSTWSDGTTAAKSITCSIARKTITLTEYSPDYSGSTSFERDNYATGIGSEKLKINYVSNSANVGTYTYSTTAGSNKYTATLANGSGGNASNYEIATSGNGNLIIKSIDPTITMADKTVTYNGSNVTHSATSNSSGTISYTYYNTEDCSGTARADAPKDAGTYSIKATQVAAGNYKAGTKCAKITIAKYNLSNATIGTISAQTYNGSAKTPEPSVTVPIPSGSTTTLSKTNDFDYSYTNNTNAGTATVTVTAKSSSTNYTGSKSKDFTINAGTNPLTVTAKTLTYNGAAQSLVTYAANGYGGTVKYKLVSSASGTCTEDTSSATIPTGTDAKQYYYVCYTAPANGNYVAKTGVVQVEIKKYNLSNATIGTISAQTYNGSAKTPEPSVTVPIPSGSTTTLSKTNDFDYSYTNNTNAGTATVTVTAKSTATNYTGSNSKDFTISKVDCTITTAPTGKTNLVYSGSAQELATSGVANGGTIYYKAASSNQTSYGTGIPKGTNVGNYTVYYYCKGDSNHTDSSEANVSAKINKNDFDATPSPVAKITGTNTWGQTLTATIVTAPSPAPDNYTYQWWYSDSASATSGTNISGATSSTYTIAKDYVGKYIGVTITAHKSNYNDKSFSDITDASNNSTAQVANQNLSVTYTLSHITKSSGPTSVTQGSDFSATLQADSSYILPNSITVKVNGTALTSGNYTYTKSTGAVSILAAKITGDIQIIATADSLLTCPSAPSDKYYTGSAISSGISCPSGSTAGGDISKTSVGSYSQTCTASSGYQFASSCSVSWKIKYNEFQISLSSSSSSRKLYVRYAEGIYLDSNYTQKVTASSNNSVGSTWSGDFTEKVQGYYDYVDHTVTLNSRPFYSIADDYTFDSETNKYVLSGNIINLDSYSISSIDSFIKDGYYYIRKNGESVIYKIDTTEWIEYGEELSLELLLISDSTQYIDANGYITSNLTSTTFNKYTIIYPKWVKTNYQVVSSGLYYEKLSDAISGADSTDTIKLNRSIDESYSLSKFYTSAPNGGNKYITVNKNITIDPNSYNLYLKGELQVSAGKTLSFNGSGTIERGGTDNNLVILNGSNSNFNLTSTTVNCSYASTASCIKNNNSTGTVTITSGTINSNGTAIYSPTCGTVNINGGTITNTNNTNYAVNVGNINMSGGTINSGFAGLFLGGYGTCTNNGYITNGNINVSNGGTNSWVISVRGANIYISNGTFTNKGASAGGTMLCAGSNESDTSGESYCYIRGGHFIKKNAGYGYALQVSGTDTDLESSSHYDGVAYVNAGVFSSMGNAVGATNAGELYINYGQGSYPFNTTNYPQLEYNQSNSNGAKMYAFGDGHYAVYGSTVAIIALGTRNYAKNSYAPQAMAAGTTSTNTTGYAFYCTTGSSECDFRGGRLYANNTPSYLKNSNVITYANSSGTYTTTATTNSSTGSDLGTSYYKYRGDYGS